GNKTRDYGYKSWGSQLTQTRLTLLQKKQDPNFTIQFEDLKSSDGTPCGTSVRVRIPCKWI
ncbi:MAG: hypothetical protein AAFP89_27670, partial [Bacteroidota bacterium]